MGIGTLVAIPGIGRASQAPDTAYNSEHFVYNEQNDTYTCPQGNPLKSNGSTYKGRNYRFKQYRTNKCKNCQVRALCTTSKINGKVVQRSEFTQYIEQNAKRALENPQAYKRRQAIVEHPYGTMKRQWGFDHIITKKTKLRASADVGLIFIAYNLTRIWNLIKQDTTTGFGISKALETAINLFLAYMAIFANHNKKIKMTLAV